MNRIRLVKRLEDIFEGFLNETKFELSIKREDEIKRKYAIKALTLMDKHFNTLKVVAGVKKHTRAYK